MRRLNIVTGALVAMLLASCATAPATADRTMKSSRHAASAPGAPPTPSLRLAPDALQGGLALQQRLVAEHDGHQETFDALLEVDADSVRVLVHRHGQIALRLAWDGANVEQTRAPGLPDTVDAARILSELQLVFWPADAIAAALPSGWSLQADAARRELRHDGNIVVEVSYPTPGRAVLLHRRDAYRLTIDSQAAAR